MNDAVAHTIVNLESLGKTQYTSFVNAVIKDRTGYSVSTPFVPVLVRHGQSHYQYSMRSVAATPLPPSYGKAKVTVWQA